MGLCGIWVIVHSALEAGIPSYCLLSRACQEEAARPREDGELVGADVAEVAGAAGARAGALE